MAIGSNLEISRCNVITSDMLSSITESLVQNSHGLFEKISILLDSFFRSIWLEHSTYISILLLEICILVEEVLHLIFFIGSLWSKSMLVSKISKDGDTLIPDGTICFDVDWKSSSITKYFVFLGWSPLLSTDVIIFIVDSSCSKE